ncbi:MAG: D-aminoacyl-tRNA deacylase [Actinobacteria bacterium]|nr:D-aminoacyl-tRNA deacylase [Actinomycetota bacterium]
MRTLIQRVTSSSVSIGGREIARIGRGFNVLAGVNANDEQKDAVFLAQKILNLRIFEDDEGKFNRSILEVGGDVLVVSQFTLYADCEKGRRPSFTSAARPEQAQGIIDVLVEKLRESGLRVESGIFGAHMVVEIVNDGPVTIILDSK